MLSLVWLALAAVTSAVPAPEIITRQAPCAPVHIIVARGSTEPQGEGAMGYIASDIKARVPGADSEGVVYPATLTNYQSSEAQGTAAMTRAIRTYVDRCPNAKIVLMGYSQGGQVALDTVCGTSEAGFARTTPLPSNYGARIYAIVTYGEPSHVINQPWNVGTSTRNGIFPRTDNASCRPYASKIRAYCDAEDQFCDRGINPYVHLSYPFTVGRDTVNFVVSKVS